MKNILTPLIGLGILAVLIVIGWQMIKSGDSSITVIEQIKKVAKLQTIEVKAATTLNKSKKDWAGAQKHTVYFAEGTVIASIDLEKMAISLDKTTGAVTLKLPAVEVANPTHDSFRIVCTHGTLTAPDFTDAERSQHTNEAFSIIRTKAEKAKIRDMALKHAKEYLTTFLSALGHQVRFV